jgi:hypothetical protein
LLLLFEETTRQGLTQGSESARLQFVAAAEHALIIGAQNPCGLFVHLLRRKLWHFITQEDEDAANKRLKQYLYGEPPVQCSSEVAEPMEEPEEEVALEAFG